VQSKCFPIVYEKIFLVLLVFISKTKVRTNLNFCCYYLSVLTVIFYILSTFIYIFIYCFYKIKNFKFFLSAMQLNMYIIYK